MLGNPGEEQARSSQVGRYMRGCAPSVVGLTYRVGLMHAFVGTCHPPSPTYLSRAAALASGIPADVPVSAVNRLCGSGLQAIRTIASAIQARNITIGMAVGAESMSQKYALPAGHGTGFDCVVSSPRPTPEITPPVNANAQAHDCVEPMGWTSEMVAQTYKISRQKQDEYAFISHTRAEKASCSWGLTQSPRLNKV